MLIAWTDYRKGKIPNIVILIGAVNALIISENIMADVMRAIIIFLLFYPVYQLTVIGAGDVKLFMMMSLYLNYKDLSITILFGFIVALLIGLVKMSIYNLSMRETKVHIGLPVLIGFLICKGGIGY